MNRLTNILSGRGWHDLVLFVVSAGLYSPSLMNGFVGDDYIYFIGNRYISTFDVKTILMHGAIGYDYCPLRDLSLAIDYLAWGENPFGFHLTNLVLYGITVVAVKYLFVRFSELLQDGLATPEATDASGTGAFLAAMLFAIHPIHREVVYAVHNRGALLTTLFCIFSCLAFISFLRLDRSRPRYYAAAFLWCVCAFMSREYGLILPLVLLLLVAFHQPSRNLRRYLSLTPFFMAGALFYCIFRHYAVDACYVMPSSEPLLRDLFAKLVVAFKIIVYYPASMFALDLPVNAYFDPGSKTIAFVSFLVVAALTCIAYAVRRRHPGLLFALLLYLACLIPVMNFFNTDPVVSDRYAYLPGLGIFFAIKAIPYQSWKRYIPVICLILISVWVVATYKFMACWKDDAAYRKRFSPTAPTGCRQ